jgi:hypothetical protein
LNQSTTPTPVPVVASQPDTIEDQLLNQFVNEDVSPHEGAHHVHDVEIKDKGFL